MQFAETARMIVSIAFVHPDHVARAVQLVQLVVQNGPLEPILQWFYSFFIILSL